MGTGCNMLLMALAGLGLFFCMVSGTPMTMTDFEAYIRPRCFNDSKNDGMKVPLINGQEYPLASTLDNFIHIVEKLEIANPDMKLEEELLFLVNNFTIYNLVYGADHKFLKNMPGGYRDDLIELLWEFSGPKTLKNDYKIPFTDGEYCSLFYMLSHTINESATWYDNAERYYSKLNNANTADPVQAADELVGSAREVGVVSVGGTNQTIAIGRVITGLYLALQEAQPKSLKDVLDKRAYDKLPEDLKSIDIMLDPLYLLTLVEPLAISMMYGKGRKGLYRNGVWRYVRNTSPQYYSVPEVCPTVYEVQKGNYYLSSYASVRGGIDGLMLGKVVSKDKQVFREKRLSEILRQYYSFSGIHDEKSAYPASFCQRQKIVDEKMVDILGNHSVAYVVLAFPGEPTRMPDIVRDIRDEYDKRMPAILQLEDALDRYCASSTPSENRNTSCESVNDIIIALDLEMTDYFWQQQRIVGHLANKINLWTNGSSVTVLGNKESGDPNDLVFMHETSSKACLACEITQRDQGTGATISTAKVVESINKLLEYKKKEQEMQNGAPGKVVIIFNFKESEPSTSELTYALNKLRSTHMDSLILAVGRDDAVLSKITGENSFNKFVTGVNDEKKVAEQLAEKICGAPAALQYAKCTDGSDEDKAVFEGLVSTNAKQYWAMDARYFEKSYDMELTVEASGRGEIQVCHNRGSRPDADPKNCEVLPVGAKKTFKHPNPCNGVSRSACSSMLFSIHGLENKTEEQLKEFCVDQPVKEDDGDLALYCKRLDQISFKVSHKGVRCNGSGTLFSAPLLVTLALVLCSVFSKVH